MKNLLKAAVALTATIVAFPAFANDGVSVKANVGDTYTVAYDRVPHTKRECVMVDVPVYGTVRKQGNAAEGALLGMILGGVLGKGVTGKDDGAAAGAVIGGLIGADKGAQTKSEQVITGYTKEKRCTDVTHYIDKEIVVYEYSTITFVYEGKKYNLTFEK
jgi:uncharacterized protein YcfJ